MFGSRQFVTYDQGWIGWFCEQALATKRGVLKEPFSISGNGKQVRDVLHADDVVILYFKMIEKIDKAKGQAFNIGGGIENSLSLLELFGFLEKELDVKLNYTKLLPRKSDQKVFVADIRNVCEKSGWRPKVDFRKGIELMID